MGLTLAEFEKHLALRRSILNQGRNMDMALLEGNAARYLQSARSGAPATRQAHAPPATVNVATAPRAPAQAASLDKWQVG